MSRSGEVTAARSATCRVAPTAATTLTMAALIGASGLASPLALLVAGAAMLCCAVAADLASREPVRPSAADRRGWPVLHRMHVLQAPEGCDYDFLRPVTPEELAFVEPVIGRS